jgi:glycosyltransferase involved in cell wall biosynthesis
VFFGGISVWLQQRLPVFRRLPVWMDRLWDSGWMLRLATKRSIAVDPQPLGELTVSTLKGERGFQAREIRKLTGWLLTEPRPDIISLPYTLLIALAGPLKRALNVPVVCALQGEDLFLEGLREPWRSESLGLIRSHAKHVDRFLAVSSYYADFMSEYLGIRRDLIDVVPIGIDLAGFAPGGKQPSDKLRIGYFARIAPEKGLHVLCEAVALMNEPAELRAAGYLPPEQVRWLEGLRAKYGFAYEGSPDFEGKVRFLQSIDVLSVPTVYREPKGFFTLEAMACGVPVVEPAHGAYPEIIEKTKGGWLTQPASPADLASKLDILARDRAALAQLSAAALEGVRKHFGLPAAAGRTVDFYRSVARPATVSR